jgi:hypothetical protein
MGARVATNAAPVFVAVGSSPWPNPAGYVERLLPSACPLERFR